MFRITRCKGFHIKFENGYTISVQWGPGNYCDNYDMILSNYRDYDALDKKAGEQGSTTAECAVLNPGGNLIELPPHFGGGDTVTNRSTPDEVLRLMIWASGLPGENHEKENSGE